MIKCFNKLIPEHLICAGVDIGRQGSCNGDSGGPLQYRETEGSLLDILGCHDILNNAAYHFVHL